MLANCSKALVLIKCNSTWCNDLDTPGGRAYKLQCKCGNDKFSVVQQGHLGERNVLCLSCGWRYNDFNDMCPKCRKNEALIIGIQPV